MSSINLRVVERASERCLAALVMQGIPGCRTPLARREGVPLGIIIYLLNVTNSVGERTRRPVIWCLTLIVSNPAFRVPRETRF